ncbi:MAG: hypothetical protein Q9161_003759 [Pseudevernia consocians]
MDASPVKQLWMHSHPTRTRTYQFKTRIERKFNQQLLTYEELRQWSILNINRFWEEVWDFTGIKASKPFTKAVEEDAPMFPRPAFFEDARLNFAENLLYPTCNPNEDSFAVIEANETTRNYVTWRELRERVRELSVALRTLGIREGDCVAGYVANHCNALLAMLASTSIGAIWTAMSPDTGAHAVLDRVRQIQPVVLFADNAVMYNGKVYEVHDKLKDIAQELSQLKACVVFETIPGREIDLQDISVAHGKACSHSEFVQSASDQAMLEFAQLQPDHGATIVLYDGSPFRPLDPEGSGDLAMPRLIEELGITHFGTSAKYLSVLEQKSVMANERVNLKNLKAIYSTGSPLAPSTFEFVYKAFGPDINLGSITGGTDIISLFGAPSQISPVFAGEIQQRGLGMAVEAWDFQGKNVTDSGEPGDLVCVKAFPCQPVLFFGADGEKIYKKSYFEVFPGVWHHGDFVRLNPQTGGLIMLGRSDGVLKPAGVRFGSSEIYNVILKHFSEIEDGLCIGRRRENDTDETVVLFLKMAPGQHCSEEMKEKVGSVIRKELSARHVPGIVDECPDIPVTINGKK